jgi:hypothetical protein
MPKDWNPPIKRTVVNGFEHLQIDERPPAAEDVKMVINPVTGDGYRAIDILQEIQDVCQKHGYALVHKPDSIRLAKVTESGQSVAHARVVAYVRMIAPWPMGIEWRDNQ